MKTLLQDLRYALRQLKKSLGFALTAIVSLTLGIGATTAVFSVVYAILVNPYPYANSDRMVHMRLPTLSSGQNTASASPAPQWQNIRKSPVVEDAFIVDRWNLTVTGHDLPEDIKATTSAPTPSTSSASERIWDAALIPSDAIDGQDPQPVAVLGYKFWQRHFNADPSVIGKNIQLVRKNYTIVGVAAPRFTWDDGDVYLPLKITPDPRARLLCRPSSETRRPHAAANAALAAPDRPIRQGNPPALPARRISNSMSRALTNDFVKDLGGTLYLLFGAVALLLAIGCGNVSILLFARGTARQHEFAVRSAIGASRRRIVRQLLTESLLLSLTGAALGVLLAYRALDLIVVICPNTPSRMKQPSRSTSPCCSSASPSHSSPELSSVSGPRCSSHVRMSARSCSPAPATSTAASAAAPLNAVLIAGQIALTFSCSPAPEQPSEASCA